MVWLLPLNSIAANARVQASGASTALIVPRNRIQLATPKHQLHIQQRFSRQQTAASKLAHSATGMSTADSSSCKPELSLPHDCHQQSQALPSAMTVGIHSPVCMLPQSCRADGQLMLQCEEPRHAAGCHHTRRAHYHLRLGIICTRKWFQRHDALALAESAAMALDTTKQKCTMQGGMQRRAAASTAILPTHTLHGTKSGVWH